MWPLPLVVSHLTAFDWFATGLSFSPDAWAYVKSVSQSPVERFPVKGLETETSLYSFP